MKNIFKKIIVGLLLFIWLVAISAADSVLYGWGFAILILLCIVPISIVAWMGNSGWLNNILKDVKE
jgi:hypothetical protein